MDTARFYKKTQRSSQGGFSLVELMVVVSISTTIISISIPNFALMKIKAARSEANLNLNAMRTLAESYHAENEEYPASFSHGVSATFWGPGRELVSSTCASSNDLGFATSNCAKMKYTYAFDGEGGYGNNSDTTRRLYATMVATSTYVESVSGYGLSSGNVVTTLCNGRATGTGRGASTWGAYFHDQLTMFESGVLQVYNKDSNYDMTKQCFNNGGAGFGYRPPPRGI